MKHHESSNPISRRDFIRTSALSGAALFLGMRSVFAFNPLHLIPLESPDFEYKYSSISVSHIPEIKEWFDQLKKEKKISENTTYRSYIDNFVFNPQEIMPGAKSLIIISMPLKVVSINFYKENQAYPVLIPTGYTDDGITMEMIKNRIMNDLIKDSSKTLQGKVKLPLKTIAVRSGLAEYGKNNISFVEGYGSFHQLIGLYTDKEMEDNWRPLKMMRFCKGCSLCLNACPTQCIRNENFAIDAGKCLTLYNELPDPIPGWIDPKSHNALVGCIKCQDICPANAEAMRNIEYWPDITAKETELILNQGTDEELIKSINKKLAAFPSVVDMPYFSRNLSLVLNNTRPK